MTPIAPVMAAPWDLASVAGTALGLIAVLGGQALEGGSVAQLFQGAALLIVLGGTVGAVLLAFPWSDVRAALRAIPSVFRAPSPSASHAALIEEAVELALTVRKDGLLALEPRRGEITDALLRRGLGLVADGVDPVSVREILESEMDAAEQTEEAPARVFEAAGGYAPTVGIIGAVLGLIHVMSMLDQPSRIGEGIAVAFVATIYGVVLANLVFLPWASKLRKRVERSRRSRDLVLLAVLGIQDGLNPHFLREKLEARARA